MRRNSKLGEESHREFFHLVCGHVVGQERNDISCCFLSSLEDRKAALKKKKNL